MLQYNFLGVNVNQDRYSIMPESASEHLSELAMQLERLGQVQSKLEVELLRLQEARGE